MADNSLEIFNTKMKAICNETRTLSGATDNLGLDAIATHVNEANTEIANQADLLAQVAAALKGKASASLQSCSVTITSSSTILSVITTTVIDGEMIPYAYIDSESGESVYEITIENVLCGSAIGVRTDVNTADYTLYNGIESVRSYGDVHLFKAPTVANAAASVVINGDM